tara:strand:+ start:2787 stop:3419 length:633 start_codon:yes stop_codon:yes gene_type:complete
MHATPSSQEKVFEIEVLQGKDLRDEAYLRSFADLRIRVFREYPYLYEGDFDYEKNYLKRYAESSDAVFVVVRDATTGEIVGASTANHLSQEMDEVKTVFLNAGFGIDEVYYFGESVLLPEWRGMGIGKRFFEEREQAAKRSPKVRWMTFCAVDRSGSEIPIPEDYRSPEYLWGKQGFEKHPELVTYFSWKEIGATEETKKPMTFWLKKIE